MKRLLLLLVLSATMGAHAQLLSWTPPFPIENNATQNLVITVDASKGNQGLLGYTPTSDVYVHIGVITNLSTGESNWKYVPFTWGTTPTAANAVYAGNNKWQFTINGSLRNYFGITSSSETIQRIAILFRNGSGSRVQRNADGGDMYIPVYTGDLAVRIEQPPFQPKYNRVPEPQNWSVGASFSATAVSNKPASLKITHNGITIGTTSNAQTLSAVSSVTAVGNQQIIAEASDGSNTRYDTLNVFVAPPSPIAPLPGGVKDGINYEPGDTSVTLVLRAPGKGRVTVIGDFNNWAQQVATTMNKSPDGKFFWLRLRPLTPGTEYAYQYIVDDTIKIADPYTEKILDPQNDQYITSATYPSLKPYPAGQTGIVSVLQTRQPSYTWNINNFNRPDKRGLIIYELLVRDFMAAHDWKTLRDSLSYLKNLGINAIELMPINEFEGNESWGYNPDFYFAPDKYYGTKNALKQFIDSAHAKGIAVIMDIALNHSFGLSPMVQLYWNSTLQRPATNNPWFNPVAKHAYNVGYDMNHESADTKYFVGRVLEHWVQEYKIDGFRFDLSKGFTQNQTCDANGNNCNAGAMSNYDASRIAILKGYYDSLQKKSAGAYDILEHFAANNEEIELADYGMLLWGNLNYNYAEAAKGNINNSNFDGGVYTARGWSKPHLITYNESHDEERIVYQTLNFGNAAGNYNIRDTATSLKRMELDAAFLLTIPGPKMLWQFGEMGYDFSINRCTNGTIDNSCRLANKPIRWDYLNDPRRKSVFNTYSKLINLRFHPWYKDLFTSGNIDRSLNGAFKWIKLTSASDTSDLVVVGNFDVLPQFGSVVFPTTGTWFDLFSNTTISTTAGATQVFSLQPGEYRVFVNRNVNNIAVTPVVNVPWNEASLQAKLYPNPVRLMLTVECYLPQSSQVRISYYSVGGQYLGELFEGFLQKGIRNIQLQKPNVAGGNYYIRIDAKNETRTVPVHF